MVSGEGEGSCEELRPRGEGPRGGHVDEAVHEGHFGGQQPRAPPAEGRVAVAQYLVRVWGKVRGEG